MNDILDFLNRNLKDIPMNTHAPATPSPTPAGKKKRASVYSVTIKVDMPLDMKNAGTLVTAMETYEKAIAASAWPEGSIIEATADIKKVSTP